jgi:phage terminase Nu1 subunit (DNA packaging protein)
MVDKTPTPLPDTIRATDLASFLGVTIASISRLQADGALVRQPGSARYLLAESVRGYIAYLKNPATRPGGRPHDPQDPLKAERIRQAKQAADKLELQNAAARGELLDRAEVEREWTDILRGVRAEMLALPSRISGRLGHLTAHDLSEIDHEIRRALAEAAQDGQP